MGNWKTDYISTKFSPEDVAVMKDKYAKLLAYHNRDSDKAFIDPQMDIIVKFDIAAKLYIKNNWVFLPEILEKVEYYLTDAIADVLPNKEKVAQLMFAIASDTHNPRDKIYALKEYAEIRGFTATEQNSSGGVQNVILVTDNGDNLTWEEKMRMQQHNLAETAERMLSGNKD